VINDDAVERGGAAAIALAAARLVRDQGHSVAFLSGTDDVAPDLGDAGSDVTVLNGRRLLQQNAVAAMARGLFDPTTHHVFFEVASGLDFFETMERLRPWLEQNEIRPVEFKHTVTSCGSVELELISKTGSRRACSRGRFVSPAWYDPRTAHSSPRMLHLGRELSCRPAEQRAGAVRGASCPRPEREKCAIQSLNRSR
jgi:hypothetical protein